MYWIGFRHIVLSFLLCIFLSSHASGQDPLGNGYAPKRCLSDRRTDEKKLCHLRRRFGRAKKEQAPMQEQEQLEAAREDRVFMESDEEQRGKEQEQKMRETMRRLEKTMKQGEIPRRLMDRDSAERKRREAEEQRRQAEEQRRQAERQRRQAERRRREEEEKAKAQQRKFEERIRKRAAMLRERHYNMRAVRNGDLRKDSDGQGSREYKRPHRDLNEVQVPEVSNSNGQSELRKFKKVPIRVRSLMDVNFYFPYFKRKNSPSEPPDEDSITWFTLRTKASTVVQCGLNYLSKNKANVLVRKESLFDPTLIKIQQEAYSKQRVIEDMASITSYPSKPTYILMAWLPKNPSGECKEAFGFYWQALRSATQLQNEKHSDDMARLNSASKKNMIMEAKACSPETQADSTSDHTSVCSPSHLRGESSGQDELKTCLTAREKDDSDEKETTDDETGEVTKRAGETSREIIPDGDLAAFAKFIGIGVKPQKAFRVDIVRKKLDMLRQKVARKTN